MARQLGILIDASHSMFIHRAIVIRCVNKLLAEHNVLYPDEIITLLQFNDWVQRVYSRVPASSILPFSFTNYIPNGPTALYDAILEIISLADDGEMQLDMTDNPIIAIMTDGEDVCSRYSLNEAAAAIQRKISCGWQFIFLCETDSIIEAKRLGIKDVFSFEMSDKGFSEAFSIVSKFAAKRRGKVW